MSQNRLDETTVLSGCLVGFAIGGLTALFRLPVAIIQRRRRLTDATARQQMLRRTDPVMSSIDTGKALAEQRRQQLELRS